MAHCPFEKLADLRDCLAELRGWPDVREGRPGIFYVKRTPFLHFHVDREGRRWADVREGAGWGAELDVPFAAGAAARRRFLAEVRRRYAATLGSDRTLRGRGNRDLQRRRGGLG
jgi:hypothetical protein